MGSMTAEELTQVLNSLDVTPEKLAAFLGMGMASLQIDTLKNKLAKLRLDQTDYNTQVEGQAQIIQAQINALTETIVKAS
ncbi:MAG: hypothetical protein ACOYM3_01090 [Terrimicrobiaceae bacterium]